MYLFELQDILFAVKSIKTPTDQFSITNYIEFSSSNTRSGATNKLIHRRHLNNTSRHSYFHRLPSLWNAMPIIDLNLSFATIKEKLKAYLWNHFISNFNDDITAPSISYVHVLNVISLNLQPPICIICNEFM